MSTPTVQVVFGAGASAGGPHYTIELDDTMNLDADGNVVSTFGEADTVWFLLHCQPGYEPNTLYQSSGSITAHGRCERQRTQVAVWTPEETSIDLGHYPLGSVGVEWMGNPIGLSPLAGRVLSAADDPFEAIARADLSYTARFYLYSWTPPNGLSLDDGETYVAEIMISLKEIVA